MDIPTWGLGRAVGGGGGAEGQLPVGGRHVQVGPAGGWAPAGGQRVGGGQLNWCFPGLPAEERQPWLGVVFLIVREEEVLLLLGLQGQIYTT